MLPTLKFKKETPYFILVRQLAIIGFSIAFFHAIIALVWKQPELFIFSVSHVIACGIVYIISKSLPNLSIHLLISSYIIGFALAPFYGVFYLSTTLIYPLMLALVIFFVDEAFNRYLYAILSVIACVLLIYKMKVEHYQGLNLNLIQEFFMVGGQLLALFFIGNKYLTLVYGYQDQLEKKDILMKKKNEELNQYIASNLQLENFAYLASHELKGPLKNILSFSKLIAKNLNHCATDKDKKMLSIVQSQASEMDHLIKDLYELSSVTNEPMQTKKIELQTLLSELVKTEFTAYHDNIKLIELPIDINGNRTYIKEVFKNLISNALKFIAKDKTPKVVIECETKKTAYEFSVTDNGIGIPENMRDKIFLIFKRLHNKLDYEGTGIGLSICKKIVERHNGDIWIENNPHGGSIFKFTIAKNIDKS